MYPVLSGPQKGDSPDVRIVKLIHGVEMLVQMGEEPSEFELEVSELIPKVSRHFCEWASRKTSLPCPQLLPPTAQAVMRYVYLVHYEEIYPKKVSLFRTGKKHYTRIANLITSEIKECGGEEIPSVFLEAPLEYFRLYMKEMRVVYKKTFDAIMEELEAQYRAQDSRPDPEGKSTN